MRKKLILLGLLSIPLINFAQNVFNVAGIPNDKYGITSTLQNFNIKAIGIGNFTTFPKSALHVNTNLLTPPNNQAATFYPGEVFRTDCPSANTTTWKMFRGGFEKVRISNPVTSPAGNNTDDIMIENWQRGAMLFRTGQVNRMIILDGSDPNALTGFVGIGNNFYAPTSQLHLNDGTYETNLQITNNATTSTATHGFKLGITSLGDALLNQQEDLPIWFNTGSSSGSQPRMVITGGTLANGFVGIGDYTTFTPEYHVDILSPAVSTKGELWFRTRTTDDLEAWISFMNSAGVDNIVNPTLYGQQSATGAGSAIYSIANIHPSQDLVTNISPVSSFIASQNWQPNINGVQRVNVVENRNIFGWSNGPDRMMTMDARGYLGIGTGIATIGNRVEINSDFYDVSGNLTNNSITFQSLNLATPMPGGANPTGFSGLTFTDLTSQSVPQLNPGIGVLSVNNAGDVILVGSTNMIGTCNDPTIIGVNNGRIDLNGNNFYFSNGPVGDYKNKVSIGYSCIPTVEGKLNVIETDPNTVTNRSFSGYFENIAGGTISVGISSLVHGAATKKFGVWGLVYQNFYNPGIIYPPADYVGVSGIALQGVKNIGVYGQAIGNPISNSWAGYFEGDVYINGAGTIINGPWAASDSILKTNTETISNALNIVNQLNSRCFYFNTTQYPYLNLPEGLQYGLIAEDVQIVLPNLVKDIVYPGQIDSVGNIIIPELTYKGLNYTSLIPITIKGIQELDSIVTTLLPLLIPDAPVLSSPANDATGLPIKPITLVWNKPERALNYFGEIAFDSLFHNIIYKFSTSDSSVIIDVPKYNTTYYWRVAATNNTGKSGFSTVFSFTTQPIPGTPILISPVNNATGVPMTETFIWSNGIKVAYNIIEVAIDPDFKNLVAQYTVKDSTIDIKLKEYNTLYYWRVTAYLFDNNSAQSQTFSFTSEIMPGTAILLSPVNGAVNIPLDAVFTWSNGIRVVKNIIDIALDPDFKNMVAQFGTPDSTIKVGLKDFSTLHYWRITSILDPNNNTGAISQTFHFTTAGKSALKMDTLTQVSYRSASDFNYKTNIGTITNPLQKIVQLNGISYDWKVNDFPNINFDSNRQLGFIAQDVEPIIPEVVRKDNSGFYSLDYDRLIPVLVEAVKELNTKNNTLTTVADSLKNLIANYETRFANIETMLSNCCQNTTAKTLQGNNSGNNREFENTEISSVIHITPDNSVNGKITELYQNNPNPFTDKTTFTYTLGKTGYVELEIHSEVGQFLAKLVSEKQSDGNYSIDWNTTDVAPGIYFYSLKVDGQLWVKKAVRIK